MRHHGDFMRVYAETADEAMKMVADDLRRSRSWPSPGEIFVLRNDRSASALHVYVMKEIEPQPPMFEKVTVDADA